MFVAEPGYLDEFSELVRNAADGSGCDFAVFATSEGRHRYSQMFVMPFTMPLSS